eukprot:8498950-Heterocapsa_arctica.AAC.1
MEPITEDEIRRVVNILLDVKAKGVDGWSPAELRSLSRSHLQGLIALVPKEGAESEGQLRPIAILPYLYRVRMAIRKCKIKQWAFRLKDGRF